MSGKLTVNYLENGSTQKQWIVTAATDIVVADGVLSYKENGKVRGFSLINVVSFEIN